MYGPQGAAGPVGQSAATWGNLRVLAGTGHWHSAPSERETGPAANAAGPVSSCARKDTRSPRTDTDRIHRGDAVGEGEKKHSALLMGKRIIRFFGVRMSPGPSALRVRFGRLIARLRRARAIAGEKAFADR